MFENINRLAKEMDNLAVVAKSSHNPELQKEVQSFVESVKKEVDKGFADVHQILAEVAYLKDSEVNQDKIRELQKGLSDTYAKDKFKNLLQICDRLHVLAERYRDKIEPFVKSEFQLDNSSQLFWLLHKHEGAFMYTIKNALNQIVASLEEYKQPQDYNQTRQLARSAQIELQDILDKVVNTSHRFQGSLSGGTLDLLQTKKVADNVLKNSPLFSLSCYLGATIILLTALTIVAGNTSPKSFTIITLATYTGLIIIGALQLRNDNKLKEENFLKLINLAMLRVYLPFSKLFNKNSSGTT